MYVHLNGGEFYNLDAVEGCRRYLPDQSVDLIITDPPYGIEGDTLDKHYNRDEGWVLEGYVEVPAAEYGVFTKEWIEQAERILRPGGQMYVVSGYTNLYHILSALRESSLIEINHIIWKYNFGVYTTRKFVSSHYHILYYAKPGGDRTFNVEARYGLTEKDVRGRSLNYQDREDVWVINREYQPGKRKNKNALPSTLLMKIMQYSSREGDRVADLFMGGFSTAKVAIELNRTFVGFEISSSLFSHGVELVKTLTPGSSLSELRRPRGKRPVNQGKRWSEAERRCLQKQYRQLVAAGWLKKDIVATLSASFGRGRFGIERMLRQRND